MVVTMGLAVFAGCKAKTTKPKEEANKPAVSQESDKPGTTEEADKPADTQDDTAKEDENKPEASQEDENKPNAKIAVNISGTVEEISEDGTKIKVDGKWIIITADTRFEDDPDNGIEPVSKEFKVGNKITGWTSGDANAEEVTADVIYSNQ